MISITYDPLTICFSVMTFADSPNARSCLSLKLTKVVDDITSGVSSTKVAICWLCICSGSFKLTPDTLPRLLNTVVETVPVSSNYAIITLLTILTMVHKEPRTQKILSVMWVFIPNNWYNICWIKYSHLITNYRTLLSSSFPRLNFLKSFRRKN